MMEHELTYQMQEHVFTGPDGHEKLGLCFLFSPAGGNAGGPNKDTEETPDGPAAVPEGTSVGAFLRTFQHFSKRQISSLKYREDGIRVNGTCRRVTWPLQAGDVLEIVLKSAGSHYLDHGTFTEAPDILYEDNELLIVNKPSGMVCHPSPGHYADTLANQAAAYAAEKNENWTIRLVGRLDKDTSGIVIFAKNSETAARLSDPSSVKKEYCALVCGKLPPSGKISLPIAADDSVMGKMKIDPAGKPAETYYETVRVFEGGHIFMDDFEEYSLLKIRLVHGRTHQIRLHLCATGHPLVGDAMYGKGIQGETHAFLHCRSAVLRHPFTGKELCITAPFPGDWPSFSDFV